MPSRALILEVRWPAGRYHGSPDWPPSPFRLFQALVAGAYGGRYCAEPAEDKDTAFRWLETLAPPLIATPARTKGRETTYYVPNNDLDAVGGDPRRVADIRVGKVVRPTLFDADEPIVYAWPFEDGQEQAQRLCDLAERLHTLGLGIDPAYARAETCGWDEATTRLETLGRIARPAGPGNPERDASAPMPGSLDSLKARHDAAAMRFVSEGKGRKSITLFRQPPKARFRTIAYGRAPALLMLELRRVGDPTMFHALPQERAAELAAKVRDLAAARLKKALPDRAAEIERTVIGRGAGDIEKERRVRFLPLPSIGMRHTDPGIRRVLVEIPPDFGIARDTLSWALAGQSPGVDADTGEVLDPETENVVLAVADDLSMLVHYGIAEDAKRLARRWRSVTPVALPSARRRGRIGGAERAEDDRRAAGAVAAALRHAGYDPRGADIRVQAEPFSAKGERAEAFTPTDAAMRARFAGRLRHVEVTFPQPVAGPLVIGDGRYLGLGLMAPVQAEKPPSVHVFAIDPATAPPVSSAEAVAKALSRAAMSRVTEVRSSERLRRGEPARANEPLPQFFHGHEKNGAPARSGRHEHLFFLADDAGDGRLDRLAIVSPRLADRSVLADPKKAKGEARETRKHLDMLDRALDGLTELRAGRAGVLRLARISGEAPSDDPLFGRSRHWTSRTLYRPARHAHRMSAEEAVRSDVLQECSRRGLPRPEVEVLSVETGPRDGLAARVRLHFRTAVAGPLLLGRGSHFGAGLLAIASNNPRENSLL